MMSGSTKFVHAARNGNGISKEIGVKINLVERLVTGVFWEDQTPFRLKIKGKESVSAECIEIKYVLEMVETELADIEGISYVDEEAASVWWSFNG